jgi:tetratricopeptide (TPR) repeat protein/transglutaminase-like putative cysteine protease
MRRFGFVFLALMASSGAFAGSASPPNSIVSPKATRPFVGPPAAWVEPVAIPPAPAAAEGAATVDLLADTQVNFLKEGDATYVAVAYKIASPQGLSDGSLQINWDPALETLTLHRYRILRDGQTLDLLGDGSKLSVIQREKNMEDAILDGRLTVSMQPEDLRVGDIIDLAYTRTRHDPAMGGRSEALAGPRDGNPYGRYRVRMKWPTSKQLNWRAYPGVLQPKVSRSSSGSELVADLNDVLPPRGPQGAPSRFRMVNAIEITEFADWASVARAFLPLYASASKLAADSPVREQAARIAAQTKDPRRRAELAIGLVQDQVRYLLLAMDDGGYVPSAADLTWSRRFGDCKAKTVLLVALLRELGIEARPVLVNPEQGDFVAERLPAMGAFDHAIVEARIAGRSYWIDGTRQGDTSLDRLETPAYRVALPIADEAKGLVPLVPEPHKVPTETVSLALDASAGIEVPAPAKGEMRFRGQAATDNRIKYGGLSAADREVELRKFWRKIYDFVTPTIVTSAVDERTGDFVMQMTGTAKMEWYAEAGTRWYELDRARLGWKWDTSRDGELNKDAPFAFGYPDYWESRETIKLPRDGTGFRLQGGSLDQTVGGLYAFHRKVTIEGNILSMEASTRALAAELPASKAEQVRSEMAALAASGVYLRVPDDYLATDADIEVLKKDKSAAANALLQRGALEFDNGSIDASLRDMDAALALDPTLPAAHSIRALALATKGDSQAYAAADRALALDSKQWLAWQAKGAIALNQEKWADAEAAFTTQLSIDEKNFRALTGRGTARLMLGRYAQALPDFDAALLISPDLPIRSLRAITLQSLGRLEDALAEADRGVEAQPLDAKIRLMRAELLVGLGRRSDAIKDLDLLVAKDPKPDYYIKRANLRPPADSAKRNDDIEAALKLDPRSIQALGLRAAGAIERGAFAAAEADIAAIEKIDSDSRTPNLLRLQLFQKQGRPRDALRIADADVAKHPKDATILNERCWVKATLNVDIDTAVADCDAALKLEPSRADILDSRAFAKLRLGAIDDAIADYDAALKIAPRLPASLFGRAIARAQKGEHASARLDLAAARKLSPDIDERFAEYGIQVPESLKAD